MRREQMVKVTVSEPRYKIKDGKKKGKIVNKKMVFYREIPDKDNLLTKEQIINWVVKGDSESKPFRNIVKIKIGKPIYILDWGEYEIQI